MITRTKQNQRMSQLVKYDGFIETAGQVAETPALDIKGQTLEVLGNIEALLASVGASKQNLTRIQIWLADMGDFDAMNAVYEDWLADVEKPVRACVESRLAAPEYLIEVQAFAYLK
ncbi:RidA family protein [Pseudogulbenkiania sp. NH8B]|uniref:RidA family protein n=1 Tax=Pseudogulbenkiania sp. (strain NH8B) TaxID=748280 RepID=UPI0005A2A0E7|nr:RidA family protein [Pseudogulbenkiania sp. NH8B]